MKKANIYAAVNIDVAMGVVAARGSDCVLGSLSPSWGLFVFLGSLNAGTRNRKFASFCKLLPEMQSNITHTDFHSSSACELI